jgi:peroxiredoxin
MQQQSPQSVSVVNAEYGTLSDAQRLVPRQPAPALEVKTLQGSIWRLADQNPERFTMVVFYRGFHCPICSTYLRELDKLHDEFFKRGISVVAISSDARARAEESRSKWQLNLTTIGYDLPIPKAREWGLYVSASRGKSSSGIEEPAVFSEPGIFVLRPDGTLYWASISTMPFARPHFSEIVQGFDFVHKMDYPARGEL